MAATSYIMAARVMGRIGEPAADTPDRTFVMAAWPYHETGAPGPLHLPVTRPAPLEILTGLQPPASWGADIIDADFYILAVDLRRGLATRVRKWSPEESRWMSKKSK